MGSRIGHGVHGVPYAGYSTCSETMDSVVLSARHGLGLNMGPVQDASWHRSENRGGTLVSGPGVEVVIGQGVARTCLVFECFCATRQRHLFFWKVGYGCRVIVCACVPEMGALPAILPPRHLSNVVSFRDHGMSTLHQNLSTLDQNLC